LSQVLQRRSFFTLTVLICIVFFSWLGSVWLSNEAVVLLRTWFHDCKEREGGMEKGGGAGVRAHRKTGVSKHVLRIIMFRRSSSKRSTRLDS
jgi:hypothetical protein